jgi:hypothetical protein
MRLSATDWLRKSRNAAGKDVDAIDVTNEQLLIAHDRMIGATDALVATGFQKTKWSQHRTRGPIRKAPSTPPTLR